MVGRRSQLALGVLLVAGGVLFLLQNLGLVPGGGDLFWSVAFAAAGAIFLYVYASERTNWWAIIPGLALLGISALIGLESLAPRVGEQLGGMLFLGALGVSFWVVYLTDHERWWAIIPGGVLVTLAAVAGMSSYAEGGPESGGLFFIGLGLTFGLLYLLPSPRGRMRWALIPAGILVVFGLAIGSASSSVLRYGWPVALILVGGYLLARSYGRRSA